MPASSRKPVWDVLEERVILSHGSLVTPAGHHAIVAASHHPSPNLPGVGTLGDSYTDEYKFYPPDQSHARNWVEILADTHRVSFGAFSNRRRGEPRDQGFAFNWARNGATTVNVVQNQLPGLASQVSAAGVQYAWVFAGGNDFLYFLEGVQKGLIPAAQALPVLGQIQAQADANFQTAVSTLLAASPNVKLVVSTVPDVALLPIVQAGLAAQPQLQPLVTATSQAIAQYNAEIVAIAATSSRIALVDLAGQSAVLALGPASASFGGTKVNLTTIGNDFHDFFLADGIHVGTIGHGIIADDFLTAIDTQFGAGVPLLTPAQLVSFASAVSHQTAHGGGPALGERKIWSAVACRRFRSVSGPGNRSGPRGRPLLAACQRCAGVGTHREREQAPALQRADVSALDLRRPGAYLTACTSPVAGSTPASRHADRHALSPNVPVSNVSRENSSTSYKGGSSQP
ncbi:MAG TPA: SGNH/GDSL hydrolase family protein [Isosphaeraceae bacterium]|jgi:hypothetical protein|nr:SGNH/GDSL hydrolase family protein [Isosphaeraceae bacterium]